MEERIKFLATEFHKYKKDARDASYDIFTRAFAGGKGDENEERVSEFWTHEYLHMMYNIICVYFETLGLTIYLKDFKEKFEPIVNDRDKATEFAMYPLYGDDSVDDLKLILEWEKYLAPFPIFSETMDEEKNRLHEFLESTNEILKFTETKVINENDINTVMRQILSYFYSDVTRYSEGYFRHKFTHYLPDILIKEIGVAVAVEYKLIREDKNVGQKLDELIIDAKRYTDNGFNRGCIAVFCLSTAVKKTTKEIKGEWKRMAFPTNWDLIIVREVNIMSRIPKSPLKKIKPKPL